MAIIDPAVGSVLDRAARRAQRLAELDWACATVERTLGIPMPVEMLPWGEVMSHAYYLENTFVCEFPLLLIYAILGYDHHFLPMSSHVCC